MQPEGTFSVNEARVKEAVVGLSRDILTLQAEGDYDRARRLLAELAVVRPPVQRVLDRLRQVPVDIEPRFVTAEELTGRKPAGGAAAAGSAGRRHR